MADEDQTPTLTEYKQQPYAIITTYGTNLAQMEADARLQFAGLFNVPGDNIDITQTGPARPSDEFAAADGTIVGLRWECNWHGWVKR